MSILFLQLLSEADSLQIDGDFVRYFQVEHTDGTSGDDKILDLRFTNGGGDDIQVAITLDDALEAEHNPQQNTWLCGGYEISLHKISPVALPGPMDLDHLEDFSVIGYYEGNDQIFCHHVRAKDSMSAFTIVAEQHPEAVFTAAIKGHLSDGRGIDFPGDSLVDADTVLDQPETFNAA